MNGINVNFGKSAGKIKPLNSMCCAPYSRSLGANQTYIDKFFKAGNIPFCRLHDCNGAYGGSYYVDVPNIFRDFTADENDPASYDFHYTDEYIGAIQKAGCESYYRLGVTIEWGSKKYTALPPADFEKWARVCEHIIMHYNEGWADGFNYGITYWEIWNEPENPGNEFGKSQWGGTKEEFFKLYKTTSKRLKNRFPSLKIGGFGGCGFYELTKKDIPESYKEFILYFKDFLKFVKENECPLDFWSWHIYTRDINELLTHAEYVRKTLDENGFEKTESHLNEWNIGTEGESFLLKHSAEGAAFAAAVMCLLQNTCYVDMAMYYCFSLAGMYNGLLDQNDHSVCPPWYAFEAFGKLYALKNSVEVSADKKGIYAAAAKDGKAYAVLISNLNCEDGNVSVSFGGTDGEKDLSLYIIDSEKPLSKEFECSLKKDGSVSFNLPKNSVALLSLK